MKGNRIFLMILVVILSFASKLSSQTNFWERINNPPFGKYDLRNITINSEGMLFVPTDSGVYRSSDNGNSWIQTLAGTTFYNMAVSPNGDVFGIDHVAVYRTTNDGVTWTKSSQSFQPDMKAIAIDHKNQIYVGGYGGTYKSTDNGSTFLKPSGNDIQDLVLTMTTNAKGHIFAGTYDFAPFRSTDEGQTWQQIDSGFSYYFEHCIAVSPNGDIFCGGVFPCVYRSTDNGDSWKSVFDFFTRSIAINSVGDIFIGGDEIQKAYGVYRSTDKGNNWEKITSGLTDEYVWKLAINPRGVVFAATESGLFRSVQPTVNVHDYELEQKNRFYLGQNYPNPFSGSTNVDFRISNPIAKRVTLKLFDQLGREIKTLFEGELGEGEHTISFNNDGLRSGQYFIRMTSGNMSKVIKTVLIK